MAERPRGLHVQAWGTYDLGKPRVRLLLAGLRACGVRLDECHVDVWGGIEDKSSVGGARHRLGLVLRWLSAYPRLVLRFLRAPAPDVVLVGYMGQLDVLVLWPFARLRGVPVVWDAFVLLYNTLVEDRRQIGRGHPLAPIVYAWEWLACRACDRVLMDTRAHAQYLCEAYGLAPERVGVVPVGAELDVFPRAPAREESDASDDVHPLQVLFYGQFIPLHGIDTIVRAARLAEDEPIEWHLIGRGQEEGMVRALLDAHPLPRLRWTPWVRYDELATHIAAADVCLGIFGRTTKAARVVPNKVYQVMAVGRPLVTRESPALRALGADSPRLRSVPAGDPAALLDAVRSFRGVDLSAAPPLPRVGAAEVGASLCAQIEAVVARSAATPA